MKQTYSYENVISLTEEEFQRKSVPTEELRDPSKYTKSDSFDIESMERLLDVKPGILSNEEYFFQNYECPCGRVLTMYDFIFTALIDANHNKSMIFHTFLGVKYLINKPRITRCSKCSRNSTIECKYSMTKYSCSTIQS